MIVRARAPLRVSFCGGGTDLAPYVDEHGGAVLSATVARFAHATIAPRTDRLGGLTVLDEACPSGSPSEVAELKRSRTCLLDAAARRLGLDLSAAPPLGYSIEVDAPSSSGLGASSAVVVATLGAVVKWAGLQLDRYDVARLACDVERTDMAIPGGLQDQYAAAFGGFNLIEFRGSSEVIVTPLRIAPSVVAEMEYHLLLLYVGCRPNPGRVIEAQVAGYRDGRREVRGALDRMKELAMLARDALVRGRLLDLGELMHEDWVAKRTTAGEVSSSRIDELYEEARRMGAVGGKVLGAGGGGFMLLVCPFGRRPAVARRLSDLGARPSTLTFQCGGLQSWYWRDGAQGAFMEG